MDVSSAGIVLMKQYTGSSEPLDNDNDDVYGIVNTLQLQCLRMVLQQRAYCVKNNVIYISLQISYSFGSENFL